jgi:Fe-S-cluster-containing dehydrogenase component/CRP-like cAMP-binding protein
MTAWPGIVWTAPALRDLDARARREVAAAGATKTIAPGERAYRDGEIAGSFFVVVEGAIHVRAGSRDGAVLREARVGETFGEEAFVEASVLRRGDAVAVNGATLAEIPGALLRRVLARGASRSAERVERTMRRAAARERLRSSCLGRGRRDGEACTDEDLDLLLDAADHVHLAQGEALFRSGDPGDHAFVVASGLMKLQRPEDGVAPAHLAAGEMFGEEDVLTRKERTYAATAAGPVWLLALGEEVIRDVARRAPRAFEAARAARGESFADGARAQGAADPARSVGNHLYRLAVATSLVLIDEAACVQCGHCAWSCGQAHPDGVSRLVRRGEIVSARPDEREPARALLMATSCQHCESAACMPVCPTGAIVPRAGGEVVLRAELCTGCGACAKACPWDAVRMAPRSGGGSVAVKCDLCAGGDGGPACVEACPTAALVRVEPRLAVSDVRRALRSDAPAPVAIARPLPAWPFVALGVALAGLAWNGPASKLASGTVAGVALALLGGHAVLKRVVRRWGRAGYVVHLALAPLAVAAIAHHGAGRIGANVAGALTVAAGVAFVTGLAGAVAYAGLPPLLARIVERGVLPEDFEARKGALEAREFAELTGKSERAKAIYLHLIRPYARARWGALELLARRGNARSEGTRLQERIGRVLRGRSIPGDEIDPLVRTAAEVRAAQAERWLVALLRGWLPIHVIAAALTIALLVAHVVLVTVFR